VFAPEDTPPVFLLSLQEFVRTRKNEIVVVHNLLRRLSVSALLALLLASAELAGQPPAVNSSTVMRASSADTRRNDTREVVRFARRTPQVGDQVEQTLLFEMRLTSTLRQNNVVVESHRTVLRSRQRRLVTMTEVDQVRPTAVQVRFLEANRQVATDPAGQPMENLPESQPVQGKTYYCRRESGQSGKLFIHDAAGLPPTAEEYEIVAQAMDMVGRVNPLAQFLADRTIAVGERVELPKEVAAQILHLGDRFEEIVRFDLTLEKTIQELGVRCAVFHARIEAVSHDASQMRMMVDGAVVVEIDSSRVTRINLSGPVAMSETRGTYSTSHQVIGTGQLKMNLVSWYQDARP